MFKPLKYSLVAAATCLALGLSGGVQAKTYTLRIASGHPTANTYIQLMHEFFVPEVTKRVAAETQDKVAFIEGWGGAMVKTNDTLEGVQSGIIDLGGYNTGFEPSKLPLHAFQVMLPFGPMDSDMSVKVARTVYDKVPYMSKVFEDKYNQKLLALIADEGYNIGTTFPWSKVSELKGRKIAGAGLNLKWLEFAGATPVQSTLPEAYTAMQTGVYDGWVMFPSGWTKFKLTDVAKYYTLVGFGAETWHVLTINRDSLKRLPKNIQDIIIKVAREYEDLTGTVNKRDYDSDIAKLKEAGAVVRSVPDSVRQEWAESLKHWPQQQATALDKQGLPATEVLNLALDTAEQLGYKWPVHYVIK